MSSLMRSQCEAITLAAGSSRVVYLLCRMSAIIFNIDLSVKNICNNIMYFLVPWLEASSGTWTLMSWMTSWVDMSYELWYNSNIHWPMLPGQCTLRIKIGEKWRIGIEEDRIGVMYRRTSTLLNVVQARKKHNGPTYYYYYQVHLWNCKLQQNN